MKTTNIRAMLTMLTIILLAILPSAAYADDTTDVTTLFDTMEKDIEVIYEKELGLEFDAIRGEYIPMDDTEYFLDDSALNSLFADPKEVTEEVTVLKTSTVTTTTIEVAPNKVETKVEKTSSTKIEKPDPTPEYKDPVIATVAIKASVKPVSKPVVNKTKFVETEVISNRPMNEAKVRFVLQQMAPDLVGIEDAIIDVYEQYGIKPSFQIAKFCLESGYGRSNLAKNKNNIAGWNAYPTKGKTAYQNATYFKTKDDCVRTVGASLSKNYINKGLTNVGSISKVYCPPNSANWASMCRSIMKKADNFYNSSRV